MRKRYNAPIKLYEFKTLLNDNNCYFEHSSKHCKIYTKEGKYLTNYAIDYKRGEVKPAYINNFIKKIKEHSETIEKQTENNNIE